MYIDKSLDDLLRLPDEDFKIIFSNETIGNIKSCMNLITSMIVDMGRAYKAISDEKLKDDIEFLLLNLKDKKNILDEIYKEKVSKRKLRFDVKS